MLPERRLATLIGFTAVLMWALLAWLTAATGTVPPFQLTAMAFAIGGSLGLLWLLFTGGWKDLRQPLRVWILGVGGLFGFHAAYFAALRSAPPVEAGLITYLWPLLIVVFSALLPGERLRWYHVAGAILGLIGAATVISGGEGFAIKPQYVAGYLAAATAAIAWTAYSILSRRFARVRTGAVAGFCIVTALLSTIAHVFFEETAWPATDTAWIAVAGLGLMPTGAAFYVWDYGVKHGDIQVLGASAYLAPLLSTAVLILFGYGEPTWTIGIAALLITGGAALASKDVFSRD